MIKGKRKRRAASAELIESIASSLRHTAVAPARARAMAPGVDRLTDAVLAAAGETDFNDEPVRFGAVLAALQAPGSRR